MYRCICCGIRRVTIKAGTEWQWPSFSCSDTATAAWTQSSIASSMKASRRISSKLFVVDVEPLKDFLINGVGVPVSTSTDLMVLQIPCQHIRVHWIRWQWCSTSTSGIVHVPCVNIREHWIRWKWCITSTFGVIQVPCINIRVHLIIWQWCVTSTFGILHWYRSSTLCTHTLDPSIKLYYRLYYIDIDQVPCVHIH